MLQKSYSPLQMVNQNLFKKKIINDKTLVAAKLCTHKARSKNYGHIVLSSNIIKKNSFQFSYLVISSFKNGQF